MKNLNLNLKLNFNQAKFKKTALKIYPKIVAVVAIGVIIWTGYFLSNLLYGDVKNMEPTDTESAEATQNQIKFNKKTLESLDELTRAKDDIDISNIGRDNPFQPTN